MTATTTSQGAGNGTQMAASPVAVTGRLAEIQQSTKEAINQYFPNLSGIENIVRYCTNIWWSESRFNCFHTSGNSRHNTIITGTPPGVLVSDNLNEWVTGRDFYTDYWNNTKIVSERERVGQTDALLDGLYAHGVSAVIGAYHIKNCNASNQTFNSPTYSAIATANNLLVEPGTRVTSIYTEDAAGRKRSIVAGLIILDYHYKIRLGMPMLAKNRSGDSPYSLLTAIGYPVFSGGLTSSNFLKGTTVTPSQAIILASGDYLGFGKDANGATGVGRAKFVMNNSSWSYLDSSSSRINSGTAASPSKPIGCAR